MEAGFSQIQSHILLTCELTRYTHCYQCVYVVNIPEPVQYHIYAMAFPFDLRCESDTYIYIYIYIYAAKATTMKRTSVH